MASPFRTFRKHQKVMLALLGLMAMIAFVFLDPRIIEWWMGLWSAQPYAVTTTRYGSLHERDVQNLLYQRRAVLSFLDRVAYAIQQQRGYPATAMGLHTAIGPAEEESVVRTWLLVQRAKEIGIVISDKSVNEALQAVTRGFAATPLDKDSKPQVREVTLDMAKLKEILAGLRLGQAQLMELLRQELLALRLTELFDVSLAALTPADRWAYFLRLNREASIEALPVRVAEFVDHVEAPDEATLRAFFDKHREKLALPTSPEPGFREPHRIAVEYLKAERDKLADVEAVTEAEIRQYYEENKEFYREEPEPPAPKPPAETPKPAAETAKPAAEAAKPPAEKPKPPAEAAKPAAETPKPAAEAAKLPAEAAKPAAEAAKLPAEKPKPAPQASKPGSSAAETEKQSPPRAETKPASTPAKKPAADESAPGVEKSGGVSASVLPFRFASFAAEEKAPAAKAPEAKEPMASPASAETKGIPPAPPGAKPDQPAAQAKKEAGPTELEPISEKARQRIRERLAQRKAEENIQKVFNSLQDKMEDYRQRWLDWEVAQQTGKTAKAGSPPQRPNFAEWAGQHKLTAKTTGLLAPWEMRGYDISEAKFEGRTPFVEYAFQTLADFKPAVFQDVHGNSYLAWKVEDAKERIPDFEDDGVRERVETTWKLIQARALAEKHAAGLAEQARTAKTSLTELFGTQPGREVLKPPAFTWMTYGVIPARLAMSQSEPRLSEVAGIPAAGHEFMRAVFDLATGEVGVAPDQPNKVYYVVRVLALGPPDADLWRAFRDDRDAQFIFRMAAMDRQEASRAWLEGLESMAGFQWRREPVRGRQE
mgnify:FL=1